jgi:hypothetical protein
MKHVGKMKNNGAKIVIVYRTLPGDPHSALVVGTNGLGESYHDSLMSLVQSDSGQQANEMADIMSVRKFPDGSNMLNWFHNQGLLKKVPTAGVLMTPTTKDTIPLDELNKIIAEQKGITIDELAVSDGATPVKKKADTAKTTSQSVSGNIEEAEENMTPAQMRSKADALFKQAQVLRKQADAIDPPKSKKKAAEVEA